MANWVSSISRTTWLQELNRKELNKTKQNQIDLNRTELKRVRAGARSIFALLVKFHHHFSMKMKIYDLIALVDFS